MKKKIVALGQKPASGSVHEKNGTYYACIRHYDINAGKRVQFMKKIAPVGKKTENGKMTITDAKIELGEMLNKLDTELYNSLVKIEEVKHMTPQELKKYNTANMNFYDYVVHYLNTHTDDYKLGGYDSYMGIANAKLKIYFKELHQYSLKDVTVDVLDEFFEYCRSVGLKGTTMKRYKSLISKPLQKAYKSRIIPENPLDFIDEISVEDFECDPLNFDESVILAEKLNDKYDPVNIVVQLALFFGLRRSEVLGLRWSAIDFENRTIFINRSIIESRTEILPNDKRYKDVIWQKKVDKSFAVFQRTVKNRTSRRKLPIYSDYLFDLLQKQKQMIETNKALFGKGYDTRFEDFVCVHPNGTIIRPDYVSDHFGVMLKKMGIRKVRYHDMRHTFATHMLQLSKVSLALVQQWLGHATIDTTIKYYGHLTIDDAIATGKTIEHSKWFDNVYSVIDDELRERADLVSCGLADTED